MKVRFKSKISRGEFIAIRPANKVIAEFLGMNWWPSENRLNDGTIEIVDSNKNCIEVEGFYIMIFMSERKFFEIIV
ncbi:hypothetical protein [Aeromonas phage Riv-10]|uniref:Uncharacterized protein n=2 Tax=Biquartavirus 44RR2 TaxID=115987 RepID=Q6U9J6_9CAUD|nr:hypothetical protein ST44RRORF106c [Aeromonas phage 44RR2.8t]AAQ81425.1 hypothetical protein 44RRORF106c [Aeromonas phage 44RR2.8t]APU00577.1 hypothetical protein [Aeromonas phage 44RR2.8t.2]APU02159.1 hypothetical protein [Aeromonas phage Riv-10]